MATTPCMGLRRMVVSQTCRLLQTQAIGYFRAGENHPAGTPSLKDRNARLFMAVIWQAVADAISPRKTDGAKNLFATSWDAWEFFYDGRMEAWAEPIGLDPDWVRRVFRLAILKLPCAQLYLNDPLWGRRLRGEC